MFHRNGAVELPARVVHHDQRAMLRVVLPHVMLNALQQELAGRHVQRFVGRAVVEEPLVDHAGHDDGMAPRNLVELGVGETGQLGGGQSVKKPAPLFALARNADLVRLDLAVGQFEPALALARQPVGEVELQAGNSGHERSLLAFVHPDGEKETQMVLRFLRGGDRGVAGARLVEIEEIHGPSLVPTGTLSLERTGRP